MESAAIGPDGAFATAGEVVHSLVAVQAQDFEAAAAALALRTTEVLDAQTLLKPQSGLVRIWTVRGTLHLVPAAEAAYHQLATVGEWFGRWYLRKVFLSAARVLPTMLRDGRIVGTWRKGKAGIEADWFEP